MMRLVATAILAASVLATALTVILTRHDSRRVFVELQNLQSRRDEINIEWGRLQLEQATWAETGRIEQVARTELGLVNKEPQQVMVIVR